MSWLRPRNGLLFGRHGSVVTLGEFNPYASPSTNSCSLEIWLKPNRGQSSGTILAFYKPDSRLGLLSLRQSLGDLKLELSGRQPPAQRNRLYIDDVFAAAKPVFLTITSAQAGTAIYANGRLLSKSSMFRISGGNLNGRMVVGNAPATTDSWSGQVKGIALYNQELTAPAVAQHFADWTARSGPNIDARSGVIALYPFNESEGTIIHNQTDPATDLIIPERFFMLREPLLERPWTEFRSDWNYWKDVAINIAGFMPLGFCFAAYVATNFATRRTLIFAVAMGLAVSLTIEILQSFLPTRDSGMTDLITNTLGTSFGAILLKWGMKRDYLRVDALTSRG